MGFQPIKRKENKITFFELLCLLHTNNISTRIKYRGKEYYYFEEVNDYRTLVLPSQGLMEEIKYLSIGTLMHKKNIEVLDIVFAAAEDDILIWPPPGITRM